MLQFYSYQIMLISIRFTYTHLHNILIYFFCNENIWKLLPMKIWNEWKNIAKYIYHARVNLLWFQRIILHYHPLPKLIYLASIQWWHLDVITSLLWMQSQSLYWLDFLWVLGIMIVRNKSSFGILHFQCFLFWPTMRYAWFMEQTVPVSGK